MVGDACDLADGGFDWSVGNSDGSITLTLADATGDGQPFYTWPDLPLGDYFVASIQVPEGYGPVVIPGTEAGPQGTFKVTLTADQPDVQLSAYLFVAAGEPTATGTLTATFFVCPDGALPSNYDPNQCELASGLEYGFDMTNYGGTEPVTVTLDDAETSDATSTWSGLPLGVWSLFPAPPDGYELVDIPNADGGNNVTGPFVVELSEATPDREIDVYFFPPSGNVGTVAFVGRECPTPDSSDDECMNGGALILGAQLLDAEGNPLPNTAHGPNLVWGEAEGLPFGTYTLVVDLSTVPEGFVIDRMIAATDDGDGDPSTWSVEVTEATPNALVFALVVEAA
jgi:hypothetical protein